MAAIDEVKIFCKAVKNFNCALNILTNASITEITAIMDRINYYLEHIKVISYSEMYKNKIEVKAKKEFLERLQNLLVEEISRRESVHKNSSLL